MNLLDLPDELLEICFSEVDVRTAKALRLTCRRTLPAAHGRLFSRVRILPTIASSAKARSILQGKVLNRLVDTISIRASLRRRRDRRKFVWDIPWWLEDEPVYQLPATFKAIISNLGLFRNLRRLELKHDYQTEGPSQDEYSDGGHIKSWQYRTEFLENVLRGLNHSDHPAVNLHSLSICNQQDFVDPRVASSDDFKAARSRLDSLELCIATENNNASTNREVHIPERHEFFTTHLSEIWLAPLQHNLVHLKLHGTCLWGYLPRADFRGLHFPRLKSLALGNMSLTHDWQMDWIVAHTKLQSLSLDDCPIVHDVQIDGFLDAENYLDVDPWSVHVGPPETRQWAYGTRWHHCFRRFQQSLPHLKHFGVAHGHWECSSDVDRTSEPFENASSLKAKITNSSYCIFQRGAEFSHWIEPRDARKPESDRITDFEHQYDCCRNDDDDEDVPTLVYPDCWDGDQAALDELMASLRDRK